MKFHQLLLLSLALALAHVRAAPDASDELPERKRRESILVGGGYVRGQHNALRAEHHLLDGRFLFEDLSMSMSMSMSMSFSAKASKASKASKGKGKGKGKGGKGKGGKGKGDRVRYY